jgi:nitroreductase
MSGDTQADLFEVIRTTRSMRRLKSHPVPNELIRKILETGTPTRTAGSSIYPTVQNMLLAGRALGVGATLKTYT